jgi:hypothetical protein
MSEEFALERFTQKNGVYLLSEFNDEFESSYLAVREKERRIYSNEVEVPFASASNPHKNEWNKIKIVYKISKLSYIKTKWVQHFRSWL